MYNVGFGDSFLMRIPTAEGERRILVDCGFQSQGKGKFTDQDLVSQIKKDLGGEALDAVVATHRHQDYISGFGETALWADIAVNEVWLPFTVGPEAVRDEPALAAWNMLLEKANGLWDGHVSMSFALSFTSAAPASPFTCWALRTPTIAPVTAAFRRVHAMAIVRFRTSFGQERGVIMILRGPHT